MVSGCPISNRSQIYFWKDFYCPELSTCSTNLNSGVFGKLIFENTIWPNYFCKKLFLCPIHMAWSLVQEFGARRWSIGVGGFIGFLEHLQPTHKNQIKQGQKHSKVFVKPHFIIVPWKSGCDRPTPLTRISSLRFPNWARKGIRKLRWGVQSSCPHTASTSEWCSIELELLDGVASCITFFLNQVANRFLAVG